MVNAKRKIEFLGNFGTIDLKESVERVYECMQEKHNEEDEKEFKRLRDKFSNKHRDRRRKKK